MADQNNTLMNCFQDSIKKKINQKIKEVKKASLKTGTPFNKGTLAADIGISPSALSHFLGKHGSRNLTQWEFYRICVILQIPPEDLAPITLAMTEEEKKDPDIQATLGLNNQDLSKQERLLLKLFRMLNQDLRNNVISIIMHLIHCMGIDI